jgi:PPM family protein phosphatase
MSDLQQALEIASATHTGMVRPHNEDSVSAAPDIGLVVLADGMGGYNAGEVASGIAVTMITNEVKRLMAQRPAHLMNGSGHEGAVGLLRTVIAKANSSIFQAANSQPQYAGMGTTLVVTFLRDNRITVAHIGDSRLYRVRDGKIEQLTRDHSLLQEQIDNGVLTKEMARRSQNKNLVTRAVGIEEKVEPDVQTLDTQEGDIYLLCSDGLNDMVEDDDILLTVNSLGVNLPLAANQLVQIANDNGGRDNVSVVLIRVKKAFPATVGFGARLRSWFS